tara:strand:+ start:3169 stop:3936 length:768 start_codon:yes stop_codon:yes gene_type:complete
VNNGWVKMSRGLLEWEWWDDHNVTRLFTYIILRANHSEQKWQGNLIKKGQFITSTKSLSSDTGLTAQQLTTSLSKLIKTGEINKQTTNRFTLITVENYNKYQEKTTPSNKRTINKQQTNNKQSMTNKNVKKEKNDKELEFESFWKKYPRKISKSKALKIYCNIPDKEHPLILIGLKKYNTHWIEKGIEMEFIPHPTTWLNQERWKDEVEDKPIAIRVNDDRILKKELKNKVYIKQATEDACSDDEKKQILNFKYN